MTRLSVVHAGPILTAQDAAVYAEVSVRLLRRLIRMGDLAAVRYRNGRVIGVRQRALDDWLREQEQARPDAVPARGVHAVDLAIMKLMPAQPYFSTD